MLVSTYFKEDNSGPRAEIHDSAGGYYIEYYDLAGNLILTENHFGKSMRWVENAAENWALGIKHLNG